MRAIADNGRFVLAEDAERLLFIERRGLVPAVAVFVAGLLTVILAVNGPLMLGLGIRDGDARISVGIVLTLAAGLAGLACAALVRLRRARHAEPLQPTSAIVILDRPAGLLRDGSGRELAPLTEVRFVRRAQLTSSSRALHVVWPRGQRVVFRGDPFAGSIDDAVAQLTARGIRVG